MEVESWDLAHVTADALAKLGEISSGLPTSCGATALSVGALDERGLMVQRIGGLARSRSGICRSPRMSSPSISMRAPMPCPLPSRCGP